MVMMVVVVLIVMMVMMARMMLVLVVVLLVLVLVLVRLLRVPVQTTASGLSPWHLLKLWQQHLVLSFSLDILSRTISGVTGPAEFSWRVLAPSEWPLLAC